MIMVKRYRLEVIEVDDERDTTLGAIEGSAELIAELAATVVERAIDVEIDAPASVAATGAADVEPAKPKRTRRTKAQIAADNAAAQLDSVQRAAVPASSVEQVSPESAPAASNAPAPATGAAAAAPAASSEQAAPYDPFAPR